jgi:NAD(P)H-dependent flavin oxidoreductase YrpB (nitropropane dioxygenase family)
MQRLKGRKAKFALVVTVLVLIVVVLLFSGIDFNTVRNPLTDAIESGESTLTAIDRNHQSITDFTKDQQDEAKVLLQTAQMSQEQANTSLTYARRTNDEFVLSMAQNYALLLDSSEVMNQGVDHLLTVNDCLQKTLNDYWQGSYQAASDNASTCLQTLEPLADQFEQNNQTLEEINYRYLA